MKNLKTKKMLTIALIAVMTSSLATSCSSSNSESTSSEPVPPVGVDQTTQVTPDPIPDQDDTDTEEDDTTNSGIMGGMASPMGARKYLHFDNARYAFIEDGNHFDLKDEHLGDNLGTLSLMDGITMDDNNIPQITGDMSSNYTDFATTYADGGNVHALTGYDQSHRVAVEKDGKYYIAEKVSNYDDSDFDFSDTLSKWDLASKVVRAEIYDHMGNQMLREIPADDAIKILEKIQSGTPRSDMENSDYESIASAQSNGLSYQVRFMFEDGTYFTSHIIPSMDNFSFGDGYGTADALSTDLEHIFHGLSQDTPPMASPMA